MVKNRKDGYQQVIKLSYRSVQRLREKIGDLTRHIIHEEPCEFGLVESNLRTIRLSKYDADGKWYGGLMCYKQDTQPPRVLKTYTINFPVETLKALIGKLGEVQEALQFFYDKREEGVKKSDTEPKKPEKENEVTMYQWKRVGSPSNTRELYWFESLCRHQAFEASRGRYEIEIVQDTGIVPSPYELTRDMACMLFLAELVRTNDMQPCVDCMCVGGGGQPQPCYTCLLENAQDALKWDLKPVFNACFKAKAFAEKLASLMDFLRTRVGGFRSYGNHLANAFLSYHEYDWVKAHFDSLLRVSRGVYILNLAYTLTQFETTKK